MGFTVLKTKVSVSPFFFAVLTLILIADKTGVSCFAVLFSLLHEFGHFLALICGKIIPKSFKITVFGMHISLPENLSTAEKIPVLIAGFTVNFLLAALFFALKNPIFAYINLIIGIFTALPVPPSDGGEVFKAILEEFFPNKAEKIFGIVSRIFVSIISLPLFFISIITENYFILIAIIYMVICLTKKAAL